MGYKCRICGSTEVEHMGDVCELCAIGQDPYASAMSGNTKASSDTYVQDDYDPGYSYTPGNSKKRKVLIGGGTSVSNTDPYGNSMVPEYEEESSVQVYRPGQVPVTQQGSSGVATSGNGNAANTKTSSSGKEPIAVGITKNITVDNEKRSVLEKWFKSVFSGIPFAMEDDVTMFQVFPDYTGTALNAMGNACDQVIVYGKLNAGAISENNDVEVYGHRDANNNVIASHIKNKASGTTITPGKTISAGVIRALTAVVLLLIFGAVFSLGVEGIIWTVVLILCLTNLPLVFKIAGAIFGIFFSMIKRLFR